MFGFIVEMLWWTFHLHFLFRRNHHMRASKTFSSVFDIDDVYLHLLLSFPVWFIILFIYIWWHNTIRKAHRQQRRQNNLGVNCIYEEFFIYIIFQPHKDKKVNIASFMNYIGNMMQSYVIKEFLQLFLDWLSIDRSYAYIGHIIRGLIIQKNVNPISMIAAIILLAEENNYNI